MNIVNPPSIESIKESPAKLLMYLETQGGRLSTFKNSDIVMIHYKLIENNEYNFVTDLFQDYEKHIENKEIINKTNTIITGIRMEILNKYNFLVEDKTTTSQMHEIMSNFFSVKSFDKSYDKRSERMKKLKRTLFTYDKTYKFSWKYPTNKSRTTLAKILKNDLNQSIF